MKNSLWVSDDRYGWRVQKIERGAGLYDASLNLVFRAPKRVEVALRPNAFWNYSDWFESGGLELIQKYFPGLLEDERVFSTLCEYSCWFTREAENLPGYGTTGPLTFVSLERLVEHPKKGDRFLVRDRKRGVVRDEVVIVDVESKNIVAAKGLSGEGLFRKPRRCLCYYEELLPLGRGESYLKTNVVVRPDAIRWFATTPIEKNNMEDYGWR